MQRILQLDVQISNWLRVAEKPGLLRSAAILLAHSGDSWFWLAGLLLLWLVGTPDWRRLAQELGLSILITAVLVMVVKFTVRRKRPSGEWGQLYRKTDPHSFPSGHAARAVLLAVLGLGLGPAWFGAVLAIWAPFVVLARTAMGVHYLSDVLAGAILGLLVGAAILVIRL